MFQIRNEKRRPFNVRVVFDGECYGLDDCLTHHETDPLIEFYDATYENDERFDKAIRGQFVARYYASTLAEMEIGIGICLDGGHPVWQIDARSLRPVLMMAKAICR